ncbi:F-box/WD repeat-containing protein 12 isoform X2 [Oncorhynchus mykiss]|nr:F-box/WD repeat-containing protein 12 isoform X2 [Oncorhynchus mykiss]XP_036843805.1 F-box/WD repeat-containing protein 12 isoform X2 [Oncorhynchus mykiss]XP_036843807.1 F-box/WD repeat-containing protein 12 isoform X2 [Oncorhynchus mykiss]
MCLQRWGFCNIAVLGSEHGKQTWKSYFLRRSHLELKMTKGRSGGDYTCKSLRGHTGRVVGCVYLSGNSPQLPDFWSSTPTVCSSSSDGTVRAWDVQQGVQLWCSPVQSPLTGMVADGGHGGVITSDSTGLLKAWDGQSGQEMFFYSSASPQCTLLPYSLEGSSFLSVGTSQGSVHTLTSPSLSKLSTLVVCDTFKVNLLLASPDKKWILAGTTENMDMSPKVLSSQSVTCPSEEEDPLCQCLPVSGCSAAAFLPSQPARLATVHCKDNSHSNTHHNKVLSVFDVIIKKTRFKTEIQVEQVEKFELVFEGRASDILLEGKGSSTLVVAAHRELKVYTVKGELLCSFKDHTEPICSICVDSFRVVTASRDLSLRVLTWKTDRDKGLTLESRYHLLGGSHSMSRGFSYVVCDYSTIVASVEAVDGKDVLKAYSFNS